MTYRIGGLSRARFEPLIGLPDDLLAEHGAVRVRASSKPGFPCRISLEDAEIGDSLILLNFISHDVPTPFRTSYAIYIRESSFDTAHYEDRVPDLLQSRTLGLRGFDADGMLRGGILAQPGEADRKIRELFERPEIATIHAHNAAYGCYLARIERNDHAC